MREQPEATRPGPAQPRRDERRAVHCVDEVDPTATFIDLYWFGLITDNTSNPRKIDPSRGILSPFLEGNRAIAQCPNFTPERFPLRFDIPVASYAYNDNSRPGTWPASRSSSVEQPPGHVATIAFADSANVPFAGPVDKLTENWYLSAPSQQYPNVHFRHAGVANVCFADGHVETRTPTINGAPSWEDPLGTALRKRKSSGTSARRTQFGRD